MPYTAAELALLDAPTPSPHLPNRLTQHIRLRPQELPWGQRRIPDPAREAEIARIFSLRLTYEEDGYTFPDHPRPKVPRFLRHAYPEWAAQDDARDTEAARAAEVTAPPQTETAAPKAAAMSAPRTEPSSGGEVRGARSRSGSCAASRGRCWRAAWRRCAGSRRVRDTSASALRCSTPAAGGREQAEDEVHRLAVHRVEVERPVQPQEQPPHPVQALRAAHGAAPRPWPTPVGPRPSRSSSASLTFAGSSRQQACGHLGQVLEQAPLAGRGGQDLDAVRPQDVGELHGRRQPCAARAAGLDPRGSIQPMLPSSRR